MVGLELIAFGLAAQNQLVAEVPQVWEDALARYCLDCHDSDSVKGSIDLEEALFSDIGEHSAVWEKTVWQLRSQQMPPEGKDRPDE